MRIIGQSFYASLGTAWLSLAGTMSSASYNVPAPASLSVTSSVGGASITYRGATNFQFLIQVSSNWVTWSMLSSNLTTNQVMTIVDAKATNQPARFYKAVSLVTPFLYQGTFSGSEQGKFLLFARTNNQATFIGINTLATHPRGEFANALDVAEDGNSCGTYLAGAPGCLLLTASNTISGKFTNATSHVAGTLTGTQKANSGIFNGAAGLYSGTVPAPHSGSAKLLLCPDGTAAFYRTDSPNGRNDGQVWLMPSSGIVDVYLSSSTKMHLLGQFTRATRTFSLIIHELDDVPSQVNLTLSVPLF